MFAWILCDKYAVWLLVYCAGHLAACPFVFTYTCFCVFFPSIFKFSDKICTFFKFEVMDYFKLEWIVHRKKVVFSLVELEGAVVFEDNCVCVCL